MKVQSSFKIAIPLILGYFPIGMTFGLVAYQQNLGFWAAFSFSAFVYAGASQFVALGLLVDGSATLVQVFIAVWLVNLRHVILSLAYLPHVKEWSLRDRLRFFPILTDETFAVLLGTPSARENPETAFRVGFLTYLSWVASTVVGYSFGHFLPNPKSLGLDFALPALFIGIISLFIKSKSQFVSFLAAIACTLIFHFVFKMGHFAVIFSAMIASLIGWSFECKRISH